MNQTKSPRSSSMRLILATISCLFLLAESFSARIRSSTHRSRYNDPLCSATRDDVYTVQILMSDTGGGHRASANALRDALEYLHPGQFECDIVDIYTDYGPFFPYNEYVGMYKLMAKYDFLWDIFYQFGETDLGLWLNELLLEAFCFEPFKQCLERPSGSSKKRADMVVSVHPLCQDIPLRILSELDSKGQSRDATARTTPFATVVTDLGGAHKTWFNSNVDTCFVPSDVLNDKARTRGLRPAQIVQYGLPIRKGFWDQTNKEQTQKTAGDSGAKTAIRDTLGIDSELPTVLIVGGGDGMGGIVDIATSLGERLGGNSSPQYQMVVVCGNNEEASNELSRKNWGQGVKVVVKGFVNNMDEWMNASDALVTKAGPGTIAEASICGLPCMLFAYLPGQEEGNVPFVETSGFGTYSGDADVIAKTVSDWLSSPEKMKSMREAALSSARPSATIDIARDLAEMAFATKTTKEEAVATS